MCAKFQLQGKREKFLQLSYKPLTIRVYNEMLTEPLLKKKKNRGMFPSLQRICAEQNAAVSVWAWHCASKHKQSAKQISRLPYFLDHILGLLRTASKKLLPEIPVSKLAHWPHAVCSNLLHGPPQPGRTEGHAIASLPFIFTLVKGYSMNGACWKEITSYLTASH